MNSKLIGSLFIVVTLVVGIVAFAPSAFAQSTASVTVKQGAGSQGCETDKSCYQPDEVNVDVGGTVTWTNTDAQTHTVSSGKPTDDVAGTVFDSGISSFKAGKTFSFTFPTAGTFDYFCQLHPWMTGEVIVGGSSVPPPAPTDNNTVPEFGPIASLILVIAIVSVIAVTAKTRGFLKL
jgi:predicted secreted protein with PEFG-CTERM motif